MPSAAEAQLSNVMGIYVRSLVESLSTRIVEDSKYCDSLVMWQSEGANNMLRWAIGSRVDGHRVVRGKVFVGNAIDLGKE